MERTIDGEKLNETMAWERFVGSQTPAQFMALSDETEPRPATDAYVDEMISQRIFGAETPELSDDERDDLAALLATYIEHDRAQRA